MDPRVRRYLVLAAGMSVVWTLPGLVMAVTESRLVVPAMATLLTMFLCGGLLKSLGLMIGAGALLQAGIFLACNAYVLWRRPGGDRPLRSWFPSIAAVIVTLILSVLYAASAIGVGRRHQGLTYLLIFGSLHVAALAALAIWLVRRVRRDARNGAPVDGRAVLAFNFCLQAAYLVALFPFVGEAP